MGQIRAPIREASVPLSLGAKAPAAYLNDASTALSGTQQLGLTLDYSKLNALPGVPVANSYYLHSALRSLTLNSSSASSVDRIGLILADRYEDEPGAFGYMFDTGFDPAISDDSYNAVAREGCAVFLDAILDKRPAPDDYETEVAFTATHELGHVFNLWHVDTPSLMKQSKTSGPYDDSSFKFVSAHQEYLSRMDSPKVYPGGSAWDDRGDLVVAPGGPANSAAGARVALRIRLPQSEFWRFEPAQLEVSVSAAPGAREVRIPNVIDPGYEAFTIWIEGPDGTRRRYRSPLKYCRNGSTLSIHRGAPFTRDIPLFGQAAGYTFKSAGAHQIRCTLVLANGTVAVSNRVEAYVRPASVRSDAYTRLSGQLNHRGNARLLFYRSSERPTSAVESLESAARSLRGSPSGANIVYSLGRSFANYGFAKRSSSRRQHQKKAEQLLKTALDSGQLTKSRERRAVGVLDRLRT